MEKNFLNDEKVERTSENRNEFDVFIRFDRLRQSSIPRGDIEQFFSDRSRVLYSSSFRRLQQKAQVFSLEPNASVRTRLTHSIEVSDIGRTLSSAIAQRLHKPRPIRLSFSNVYSLVAIVETACLLHDIGNPPFGHFGEAAIKDWAAQSQVLQGMKNENNPLFDNLMEDFYEFDGNPQGFRVVTKLHTEQGDEFGLNLTYSTLMSILKYSRAAGEKKEKIKEEGVSEDIIKKAGYFQSEKEIVEKIYKDMGIKIHHRYPLTYIMEAADDIAYCMSDIADGIEKGILTEKIFIEEFEKNWNENYAEKIPIEIPDKSGELKGFNIDISIPWSKAAINEAVEYFLENANEIKSGSAGSLINNNGKMGKVFETVKRVSKKHLYTSTEAESIETTGYAVITGILKRFERLIKLSTEDFTSLVEQKPLKGRDYEIRLFHLIGKRYVEAYKYAVGKLEKDSDYSVKELWLRIHLIVDQVSGMTDDFALETYQMLEGIRVARI